MPHDGLPETLRPGIEETVAAAVTEEMTAPHVGSGSVAVLATPVVLALVERAAVAALDAHLAPGQTSVGIAAEISHTAPTPPGATVRATARVEDVSGRRVRLSFSLHDPAGEVASGTHARVVVDRAGFEARAQARSRSSGRDASANFPT